MEARLGREEEGRARRELPEEVPSPGLRARLQRDSLGQYWGSIVCICPGGGMDDHLRSSSGVSITGAAPRPAWYGGPAGTSGRRGG